MENSKSIQNKSFYLIASLVILLFCSSILLFYFNNFSANDVYLSVTAFHIVLGFLIFLLLLVFLVSHLKLKHGILTKRQSFIGFITLLMVLMCIISGLVLTFFDLDNNQRWIRIVHPVSAVLSLVLFFWHKSFHTSYYKLSGRIKWHPIGHPFWGSLLVGFLCLVAIFFFYGKTNVPSEYVTIGPDSIFPGEARVEGHSFLDSEMLDGSVGCSSIDCHPDVYEQWSESMHHFSSFNNPYYSKSIEVLRNSGKGGSVRWCASCHDPLPLLSGKMQGNLEHFNTKSHIAQAGITCLSCHAIQKAPSIEGNGKYEMGQVAAFNKLGDPMTPDLHKALLKANPEPHINAMLDPMLNTAKFCVSCHKVSIPPAINGYRWKRGQDQYDSWQRSGVSGNNVSAFYFPEKPKNCISCHMPNVPSNDKGNKDGFVKSHRFAGANTAVPFIKGHKAQLNAVQTNLTKNIAELDMIKVMVNGREIDMALPLPQMGEGEHIEFTLVVNNRKVGHRMPAGTNDTNEWWLEVIALDEYGKTIMASGAMDEMGRVDSTAHFLRTILLDKKGNIVDKRNVNDIYATAYNNTIAPGTAQLVRFQFTVPEGRTIRSIKASLKQRKFNWYYDNFTFGGEQEEVHPSKGSEEGPVGKWIIPFPQKPKIPVTTVASTTRSTDRLYSLATPEWKRWNDLGIGLLLEGSNKEAYKAFAKVEELDGRRADGAINKVRVLISEGSVYEALEILNGSLDRFPENDRIAYFLGKGHEALGEYGKALSQWMKIYASSPSDFRLLLDISNSHYLLGEYEAATRFASEALAIDPEDFSAIYQQMLIYQAAGNLELAEEWKKKYEYHRINEKEEFVIADFLEANPHVNLETQDIHFHELKPKRVRSKSQVAKPQ